MYLDSSFTKEKNKKEQKVQEWGLTKHSPHPESGNSLASLML